MYKNNIKYNINNTIFHFKKYYKIKYIFFIQDKKYKIRNL